MRTGKIGKILVQTIIKELGGKITEQGEYLDGIGMQFNK
jgi:hypothetical protein